MRISKAPLRTFFDTEVYVPAFHQYTLMQASRRCFDIGCRLRRAGFNFWLQHFAKLSSLYDGRVRVLVVWRGDARFDGDSCKHCSRRLSFR